MLREREREKREREIGGEREGERGKEREREGEREKEREREREGEGEGEGERERKREREGGCVWVQGAPCLPEDACEQKLLAFLPSTSASHPDGEPSWLSEDLFDRGDTAPTDAVAAESLGVLSGESVAGADHAGDVRDATASSAWTNHEFTATIASAARFVRSGGPSRWRRSEMPRK